MSPQVAQYWNRFRSEPGKGDAQLFDVFKVGISAESANEGLALILSGAKTTTGCLPEEFQDTRPPQKGDLSIVTNWDDEPGGVVETVEAELKPFDEVTETFAHDYGEWDRTLATWREKNRSYYASLCRGLGINWHEKRELICETFRLIHRADAPAPNIEGG